MVHWLGHAKMTCRAAYGIHNRTAGRVRAKHTRPRAAKRAFVTQRAYRQKVFWLLISVLCLRGQTAILTAAFLLRGTLSVQNLASASDHGKQSVKYYAVIHLCHISGPERYHMIARFLHIFLASLQLSLPPNSTRLNPQFKTEAFRGVPHRRGQVWALCAGSYFADDLSCLRRWIRRLSFFSAFLSSVELILARDAFASTYRLFFSLSSVSSSSVGVMSSVFTI